MTNRTTIDAAIGVAEEAARKLMAVATSDSGSLSDVGSAAAGVHVLGLIRRKHGPWGYEHERVESERLAALSRRLVELDDGDIAAATATAILITKKPVKLDEGE